MATLTLIGEPLSELEATAHAAAARQLAEAVAETAPRGFSSRLLVARDTPALPMTSPRASIEAVPLTTGSLPLLWRTSLTARPLDGEFVHAATPLVPLRTRVEDDGSQTSVLVPHLLAWQAPELMGEVHAKNYRAFVRRAASLADILLAPTHSVAQALSSKFDAPVQVLQLAAPAEYLGNETSATIRNDLSLPARYIATTALPGTHGRLEWVFDALLVDPMLPDLVVLQLSDDQTLDIPAAIAGRVHVVSASTAATLSRVGAVISNAQLLAMPQRYIGAGFEVLAAIAAHVPLLHSECEATAELALEAGLLALDATDFASALSRLLSASGTAEMARLRLYASDRAKSMSWLTTARQLWELHANL